MSRRVLLLQQGGRGGVERVGKLLTDIFLEISQHSSLEIRTLRRNDRGKPQTERRVSFAIRALLAFHRFRPHLVVFDHANLAPLRFGMFGRARFVTVVHGWDVWLPISRIRRAALASMSAVWSVSEYTTSRMRAQGVDIPARLLRLGISDGQRQSLNDAGKRSRRSRGPLLLSVARLDPRERHKGIDHVIEALPVIARQFPEVQYVIVGEGGDTKRLEGLASDLGVANLVQFRGHVSEAGLALAYGDCDVFVLPSEQEGFGLVFIEAMAAGRPIVAARAGGVPEVVTAGRTGLLVEYGDVGQIARSVIQLLVDPELRASLGRAGQERVQETFTMRCLAETVTGLLTNLGDAELVAQLGSTERHG